jgi:hypothetical protein
MSDLRLAAHLARHVNELQSACFVSVKISLVSIQVYASGADADEARALAAADGSGKREAARAAAQPTAPRPYK